MIIDGPEKNLLVQLNTDNWKTMKEDRSVKEDKWMECIRAYLSMLDPGWTAGKEWRSRRYVPLAFDAVENLQAFMMGALLPKGDDWFDVEAGRIGMSMFDDKFSEHMRILMQYHHENSAFRREAAKVLKWLLVIGNCPYAVNWKQEHTSDFPVLAEAMENWQREQLQAWQEYQAGMKQWEMQARAQLSLGGPPPPPPQMPRSIPSEPDQVIAYEGPKLICCDPFEYVEDPYADDPDYAVRITRFWRRKSTLMKMTSVDEYGYSVYDSAAVRQLTEKDHLTTDERNHKQSMADAFQMTLPKKDAVECKEMWGTFEVEGEVYTNHVLTVANDSEVLRFEPSYLWSRAVPRRLATLISVPGQLYGMGILEPALGVGDLVNARANQQIDAGAVAINPEVVAVEDGVFDPDDAESGPFAIHMVREKGNLAPMVKNLQGLEWSMAEISSAKGEYQQITRSVNPFTTQSHKKSATEISRDSSVSGASLQNWAENIEISFLLPALQLEMQHIQQYTDADMMAKITQEPIAEDLAGLFGPAEIRQNWILKIRGASAFFEKAEKIQQTMMMYQMTAGNQIMASLTDLQYLASQIWKMMGNDDGDRVFPQQYKQNLQILLQHMQKLGEMNAQASQAGQGGEGGGEGAAGGAPLPADSGVTPEYAALLAQTGQPIGPGMGG